LNSVQGENNCSDVGSHSSGGLQYTTNVGITAPSRSQGAIEEV